MRSTIKITLGAELVIRVLLLIAFFVLTISLLVSPNFFVKYYNLKNNQEALWYALFYGIATLICLLSVFVTNHAIKKMDEVDKKSKMIITFILLLVGCNIVSLIMMIFTPKKKLLSSHPYFE